MAGRRLLMLHLALWCSAFICLVASGLVLLRWHLESHVAKDQQAELERIAAIRASTVAALRRLASVTSPPCSSDFVDQMREVAFRADGLNEFLYAPGGKVLCNTAGRKFDPPVELGEPEIHASAPDEPSWRMDRDLGVIRHPGVVGTIAQLGDFAVALPRYTSLGSSMGWMAKELVAHGKGDEVWSLAGERGLHDRMATKAESALTAATTTSCTARGAICIASRADLLAGASDWRAVLVFGAAFSVLLAWILASAVTSWIGRHWMFAERFRRRLSPSTLVLAYQPIVDLANDEITCVEVLARWRDFDGTIVSPDHFIPLVVQFNRTQQFTRMVIDRAYEELSRLQAGPKPLRVNFNIFPVDLDSALILDWLDKFRNDPRLRAAIELVEEQYIDFTAAQRSIEALSAAGIPTYIDDFGSGYSNLARIARLPVEGVKLDRAFAMSPPDSVTGRMLLHVLELLKTTGRVVVVEGVENLSRLELLRSTGMVDLVQGYVVSRPLQIDDLADLLAGGPGSWTVRSAAA